MIFVVKKSVAKDLFKSLGKSKLEELKREVIEILKKQDEKEYKKAIEQFTEEEEKITCLEKSISGEWVEKAGYGIGTVRVWKGKKYKKIAPGKWARMYEKEDRGANIAVGKLIAKVKKIDDIEELMNFVMQNKQRFQDENGKDLPILDKIRAEVDEQNKKISSGKVGSKGKTVEDKVKENPDYPFKPMTDKERAERAAFEKDRDDFIERMDKIRQENKKKDSKPAEKKEEVSFDEVSTSLDEMVNKNEKSSKIIGGVKVSYDPQNGYRITHKAPTGKEITTGYDTIEEAHQAVMYRLNRIKNGEIQKIEKTEKEEEKHTDNAKFVKEVKGDVWEEWNTDPNKFAMIYDKNTGKAKGLRMTQDIVDIINSVVEPSVLDWQDNVAKKVHEKYPEIKESYIKENIKQIRMGYRNGSQEKIQILNKESEMEKHKNRSEAMKGNKNAKKYGLTDDQIEYYDIQKVVEEINGYPIIENSEGKYSFVAEGHVKDRPEDFETNIDKVKERINDHYETEKNIKAAKNYDFKNAKLGLDVQYTKKNNGNHLYFKKSPDGSKVLSVTVNISDMREPLNMVYEVTDTKSGESWQYETAYGNKEGLEWAVEKPEQMEKALKKFFKRDPNKEWEKQNTFEKETVIDRSISTNNPEKLKPIAKSESIGEGKVKMPYSKEVSDEIKHLTNTSKDAVTKGSRYDFLTKIYYDKGNLVSTDGNKLKIVKVGELDGIDNGTFVDIDNSKEGITITADKEFSKDHKFPQYERVIPDENNEKIVLDNKALISKIKELKKDGGITTKDSYVTFDIQGNNLMLDGVKVGDVSAANFEGENSDYINLDADILTSYLSGDKTDLYSSKDSSKAMYFGNGSAINIIMPQRKTESHIDANGKETIKQRRKDYESMRKDKEIGDEAKANKKAAQKTKNNKYVTDLIERIKKDVEKPEFGDRMVANLGDWTTEQLQRLYKQANADIEHLSEIKDFNANSFMTFTNKNFGVMPRVLIQQNYAMKQHPEIVKEIERLLEERGAKVEKSLFDDFIMDVFEADEDEEIEDAIKTDESLFNDYSAKNPDLFNSVAYRVANAFDECGY